MNVFKGKIIELLIYDFLKIIILRFIGYFLFIKYIYLNFLKKLNIFLRKLIFYTQN
jgi:hypothetical protein